MPRLLAILALTAVCGWASAASETCSSAAFHFTPESEAVQRVAATHSIYLRLHHEGWYVGEMGSTVPVVSDGSPGYTCPMVASGADKGTRTAEVVDEHGNVLATLSGKNIDKDVARIIKNADSVVPEMRKQAAAVVAKARTTAKKDAKRAMAMLTPVAQLKGWAEGDQARALLNELGG
jgi:hypothetical protein